jgi:antitoxin (DNA-binding transcriptional repressor) of toxin-antitoxin stability system
VFNSDVRHVKTITTREFYHSPGIVKGLRAGQSVVVTDNGRVSFTVVKAGQRPKKTAADLRREAHAISPKKRPKLNFTAWLKEHRA